MTLAEVIHLAWSKPDDERYENRFFFVSERTETADDLLHDNALEVRSVAFDEDAPAIPGLKQMCLFETVVSAGWRNGRKPTEHQAARAIVWYRDNDAFIPPDQD